MQKTYALFDFDGTLIGGDSIILFMRYAWRKKLCSAADVLRFLIAGGLFTLHLVPPKRGKEIALGFLKGRSRAEFTAAAEDFCQSVLAPRLYRQGAEAVRRHLDAGQETLLITASPTFYLEPLRAMLGFSAVLGTEYAADETGRFTGEIEGQNCRGDQKPLRLQEYLAKTGSQMDAEASSAYGDSTHDLPMLGMVGHAYAVNPGKKLIRRLPELKNVAILRWKGTL